MMVESTELFPGITSDYSEASGRAYNERWVLRDGLITLLERETLEELLDLFQQDAGVLSASCDSESC